jgi:ParB family chromosome partitioning protein
LAELKEVELSKIRPNRLNPRLDMNIERLNELADSIKQVGLLEPIIVRPAGAEYEVVVGERRYRASQQAGLKQVPAIVREFTEEQVIALNLVENIHREDLSAVEKGNCCKQLLERYPEKYPSKEAVGQKLGVSPDTVNNWLRLTEAPTAIQRLVAPAQRPGAPLEAGKLDYSTALSITRQIQEPDRQMEVAKELASKPVHGRQARQVVRKAAEEPKRPVEEILKEVIEQPLEFAFSADDRNPILKGSKTQTTSAGPFDPRIRVGSVVRATVREPDFADLRVVSIERKRLKYFNADDARAEGGYTLEEFKRAWRRRHGQWNENDLVHVMRFEKV